MEIPTLMINEVMLLSINKVVMPSSHHTLRHQDITMGQLEVEMNMVSDIGSICGLAG